MCRIGLGFEVVKLLLGVGSHMKSQIYGFYILLHRSVLISAIGALQAANTNQKLQGQTLPPMWKTVTLGQNYVSPGLTIPEFTNGQA